MQLISNCDYCKEEIRIKSYASSRPALEMDKGERFEVRCEKCRKRQEKHVNDVRAKPSRLFITGGLIIGIVFTLVLWMFFGGIAVLSFAIPGLIWQQESKSVHGFNSYRTRRN